MNLKETIKAAGLLIAVLAASRLIGLPANFTPLLGLAVFAPRLNLSPWTSVGILAVTDIVLGFYSLMPVVYACMLGAYYISQHKSNVYAAGLLSCMLWHIVVNSAVVLTGPGFAPFTPEAMLFDMRLIAGTLMTIALLDVTERVFNLTKHTKSSII